MKRKCQRVIIKTNVKWVGTTVIDLSSYKFKHVNWIRVNKCVMLNTLSSSTGNTLHSRYLPNNMFSIGLQTGVL